MTSNRIPDTLIEGRKYHATVWAEFGGGFRCMIWQGKKLVRVGIFGTKDAAESFGRRFADI